MSLFLILAYLFFIGSLFGWVLELFYRRFLSDANPERKWINPGFCVGPYVPLYGFGLCILYLLATMERVFGMHKPFLFFLMAVCMTLIEYLAGLLSLKWMKIRLWDYSNEWGNLQGLICPKFSLYWAVGSAGYYFLIHPRILNALAWLSRNLAFSFVIGYFFGVFTLDVIYSAKVLVKLKAFAEENNVVVRYEHLKAQIRKTQDELREKRSFLFAFHSTKTILEHLRASESALESRIRNR